MTHPATTIRLAVSQPPSRIPVAHGLRDMPGCSVADLERSAPHDSEALATYLRRVYGSAPAHQLQTWRWHLKDVVHFDYLLPHVQALCTKPLGDAPEHSLRRNGSGLPTHAFYALPASFGGWSRHFAGTRVLWHFDHTRACPPGGARIHHGGDPDMSVVERRGWVEVMHVAAHERRRVLGFNAREFLWMNRAHGSGLWYNQGQTRVHDDFGCGSDCSPNETSRGGNAYLLQQGAAGLDTVVFERRVGSERLCTPTGRGVFYMYELVGLQHGPCGRDPAQTACPNAMNARQHTSGGWQINGTECLYSAWDLSSLRWGWPDRWPLASRCPTNCTHQKISDRSELQQFRIGCNWSAG